MTSSTIRAGPQLSVAVTDSGHVGLVVPWPAAPPGPGCHLPRSAFFAVLQKRACFSVRAEKGKTVLCRSADKSLPLVTHCLTNAHSYFLKTQPPSDRWLVSVDSEDCKDPVIHPFFFFEMMRFYLPVWSCMWFNHVTSFGAFVYQLCGNGDSAPFCPIFLSDNH